MKGENLFSEIIIQLSSRHKKCKLYWFRCSCIVILLLCHLFVTRILTVALPQWISVLFSILTKGKRSHPSTLTRRISMCWWWMLHYTKPTAHEQKLLIFTQPMRWGNQKCNSKCKKMINILMPWEWRCGVSSYQDGWGGAEHTRGQPNIYIKGVNLFSLFIVQPQLQPPPSLIICHCTVCTPLPGGAQLWSPWSLSRCQLCWEISNEEIILIKVVLTLNISISSIYFRWGIF